LRVRDLQEIKWRRGGYLFWAETETLFMFLSRQRKTQERQESEYKLKKRNYDSQIYPSSRVLFSRPSPRITDIDQRNSTRSTSPPQQEIKIHGPTFGLRELSRDNEAVDPRDRFMMAVISCADALEGGLSRRL